jgi:DNA gyrase/topoisomerase IV subunit A
LKKNSNNNSQLKKLSSIITEFTEIYNSKITGIIQSENVTIEELNKISAALAKNIPDIIKLQDTINETTNKKEVKNNFTDIFAIIKTDENASHILEMLLNRISEITESN